MVLTNVQLPNAGKYTVVVTNAVGAVSSTEAILKVNPVSEQPPRITRVERDGDTVKIVFTIQPTFQIALESTDALPPISWTILTNFSAKVTPIEATVPDLIDVAAQRFYRLRVTGRVR